MIDITQRELEQLIRENTRRIGKSKQTMVRKDSPEAHGPGVQDSLVAQTGQTRMAVNDIDSFPQHNVPENGKETKHGRKGGAAVDDQERHVVDFQSVGQVAHASPPLVGVGDDDYFVAAVDEFGGQLVDVRFDAAGLREEEVADHGDAVCGRHGWLLGDHIGPIRCV